MTTTDLLNQISCANESTLRVYVTEVQRKKSDGQLDDMLSNLFDATILKRRAQLSLIQFFAEEIRRAVNVTPLLQRIESAVKDRAISEDDQLQLIHLWELRNQEIGL